MEVREDFSSLMSGLVADKDVVWASEIGGYLQSAQWDRFFTGLEALYAGAVYGTTEGKLQASEEWGAGRQDVEDQGSTPSAAAGPCDIQGVVA
jgi:hypothetical protein